MSERPESAAPRPPSAVASQQGLAWRAVAAATLAVVLQPGVPGGAASWAIATAAVVALWVASSRSRLSVWVAPAAALTAWAVALAAPYSGTRAGFACAALAVLLATGSGPAKIIAGGIGLALTLTLAATWTVLLLAGARGSAGSLFEAAAAWLSGVAAWIAMARLVGHGRPADDWTPWRTPRLGAAARAVGSRLLRHRLDGRAETAQGVALVLLAAMLPVGEGAAFGAAGLLLVLLLVRGRSVDWPRLAAPPAGSVFLALVVWLAAAALAAIVSGNGLLQPRELGRVTPWLLAPVAFLGASSIGDRWRRRAATAFVVALAVSCLVGLLQYHLNPELDAPGLRWLARISAVRQAHVPGQADRLVAGGFYLHRLKLAHVLVLGIGLVAARQLLLPLALRRRILELAVLALFFYTLILTYARASLLGLLAGTAAVALLAPRRWKIAAAGALVLAAVLASSSPTVRARIASIAAPSASSQRVLAWSVAVATLASEPWGVGLGNYPALAARGYERHSQSGGMPPNSYAHSLVLSAWVEAGPIGLLAFLWVWLTLAWRCWRAARGQQDARNATAAGAGLFAVSSFWVIGMTHDVLYHKPVALTFAAVVGFVLAVLATDDANDAVPRPTRF